ncbi:hypothetical protein [Luteitalea pratensis]|uniref:hypothetical protein n=1 Tax=Luteitalea pratensis TaxID=1855912 RepID=UPI0012FFC815|nr:hypothetical protein [Luteitalea pratensis]
MTPAWAQDPQAPVSEPGAASSPSDNAISEVRPGWLEVSVLGGLFGGGDLGDGKAEMLTNQIPTSGMTALFTTSARIEAAPLIEARVGVRLGRNVWGEGGGSYARPDFTVDIASDIEGAPDVTAISKLTQVTVDGSLQYRWTRSGRRLAPFVMAGAGYLRQLDDTRATAETGWLAQGGGGVLMRLSTGSGFMRRLAIRGDVRAIWLRDGIVLNAQRGATFMASAGMTLHLGGGIYPVP